MIPRVLIVDDVAETRSALAELLEASGEFEVCAEAADGREAIDCARTFLPDIILMDIRMPNLDGIEATRAIVSEGLACQVIAHSAYQDVSLVRDMIAAGAKGYVLKGSDADRLLATLHAAVNGHAVLSPEVTDPYRFERGLVRRRPDLLQRAFDQVRQVLRNHALFLERHAEVLIDSGCDRDLLDG